MAAVCLKDVRIYQDKCLHLFQMLIAENFNNKFRKSIKEASKVPMYAINWDNNGFSLAHTAALQTSLDICINDKQYEDNYELFDKMIYYCEQWWVNEFYKFVELLVNHYNVHNDCNVSLQLTNYNQQGEKCKRGRKRKEK